MFSSIVFSSLDQRLAAIQIPDRDREEHNRNRNKNDIAHHANSCGAIGGSRSLERDALGLPSIQPATRRGSGRIAEYSLRFNAVGMP
jgi:hypothetical protein